MFSAVLIAALLPALAAAQEPPPVQDPQLMEPQILQPLPAPPPPTVVYYVPYFVPYAVFVPAVPPQVGKHVPAARQPNLPPPPAVGMLAGPPVSATGVFVANPATGMFAGAPATGMFAAPPKAR